ncbi:Gfo/Idh/MocA family oxidoreductase [Fulvivirga sp. M361]|uniref:Gfo/Idh/MocA family protein n=1 Tax=Fulvivirga sp. M361 TaxID=2594266 RepID=UPI00117B3556|nr:Gfo/Idh/MocA family oxidoreductase [Fulvivirga sp. M361]TRX49688.1 Gfo/Idh/MocA family oxidoreductase [Fulvivirga sp. M361]
MNKSNDQRRKFLKKSALAGLFLGMSGIVKGKDPSDTYLQDLQVKFTANKSVIGLKIAPIKQVKVGIIGVGMRGSGLMGQVNALCNIGKAKITAICDIREQQVTKALEYLKKNGKQKPATYHGKEDAWKELARRDDIDLIIIATPWEYHVPMSLYAMDQGKHVGVEVPAALTVEDCWKLVDKAEEKQLNCIMLENVCYGNEELWVLNMVQNEVFGTLTYAEAAYIHDLRGYFFKHYYNDWRVRQHIKNDGNLYPTHGLGPVAQYLGVNRGDHFQHMVSMSSCEAGLTELASTLDKDHEFHNHKDYAHGDMNNSLIKTGKGRTILLQHDVITPRPYNRINALAGTRAYHEGYPSRLSLLGKGHGFLSKEEYGEYRKKFTHPLWTKLADEAKKHGGHGGMDFIMIYRLIDCFNNGWPLDMDVYDAAAWSAVTPLSKLSIELGNVPVKFPDFTRGRWKEARKLGVEAYL